MTFTLLCPWHTHWHHLQGRETLHDRQVMPCLPTKIDTCMYTCSVNHTLRFRGSDMAVRVVTIWGRANRHLMVVWVVTTCAWANCDLTAMSRYHLKESKPWPYGRASYYHLWVSKQYMILWPCEMLSKPWSYSCVSCYHMRVRNPSYGHASWYHLMEANHDLMVVWDVCEIDIGFVCPWC